MSCGAGHRHGSDPTLLWLWHTLAAVALIGSPAWELPCAMGAAKKRKEKKREGKGREGKGRKVKEKKKENIIKRTLNYVQAQKQSLKKIFSWKN